MISEERLREIEARCSVATEGPWEWIADGTFRLTTTHSGKIHVMRFCRNGMQGAQPMFRHARRIVPAKEIDIHAHPDAQFIAHARQDIPELIEEVLLLQSYNQAQRALIDALDERDAIEGQPELFASGDCQDAVDAAIRKIQAARQRLWEIENEKA